MSPAGVETSRHALRWSRSTRAAKRRRRHRSAPWIPRLRAVEAENYPSRACPRGCSSPSRRTTTPSRCAPLVEEQVEVSTDGSELDELRPSLRPAALRQRRATRSLSMFRPIARRHGRRARRRHPGVAERLPGCSRWLGGRAMAARGQREACHDRDGGNAPHWWLLRDRQLDAHRLPCVGDSSPGQHEACVIVLRGQSQNRTTTAQVRIVFIHVCRCRV